MENKTTVKVPFRDISKHFVDRPKRRAITYWRNVGLLNGHRQRVKFQVWRDAGRLYTTLEEIARFKEAIQEGR